jgi:hypothetical protein
VSGSQPADGEPLWVAAVAAEREHHPLADAAGQPHVQGELSGVETFVTTFVGSRLSTEPHASGLRAAVATLDDLAERWHGDRVAELPPETRERLLGEVGADTAQSDPDGTDAERVRYYVVNELLLALYTSPTGGELVGIENPQGHPGGVESYQRGPR